MIRIHPDHLVDMRRSMNTTSTFFVLSWQRFEILHQDQAPNDNTYAGWGKVAITSIKR